MATSYANGDKFFIDPMKLLPLDRFLPKLKGAGVQKGMTPALSSCRCCIRSDIVACRGCQAAQGKARGQGQTCSHGCQWCVVGVAGGQETAANALPSSSRRLLMQVDVVEQEEVAEAVAGGEALVAAVVAVAALAAGLPVAGGYGLCIAECSASLLTHIHAQMDACAN